MKLDSKLDVVTIIAYVYNHAARSLYGHVLTHINSQQIK